MSAVLTALQAALDAENAAVYGYGVAGARLTGRRQAQARKAWVAHEAARDTLTAMVTARGGTPAAAAAAYRLPFAVHDARTALSLAGYLEERLASAYLGLVALPDHTIRMFGARGVRSAALRAAAWRGHTVAFPGIGAAARPGTTTPPRTPTPGPENPTSAPAPGRDGSTGPSSPGHEHSTGASSPGRDASAAGPSPGQGTPTDATRGP